MVAHVFCYARRKQRMPPTGKEKNEASKVNPASVPWHWIKSQRQSFEWSRKEQLYCFGRQRGTQQDNALKPVCPNLEGEARIFIAMVQRGHDQLMGIFLIDWWWSKWESASSTFWFQLAIYTVNFSHLVGVSVSAKELKDIVKYILWRGTKTLPQDFTISFDCSSFDSVSPPFPK